MSAVARKIRKQIHQRTCDFEGGGRSGMPGIVCFSDPESKALHPAHGASGNPEATDRPTAARSRVP